MDHAFIRRLLQRKLRLLPKLLPVPRLQMPPLEMRLVQERRKLRRVLLGPRHIVL